MLLSAFFSSSAGLWITASLTWTSQWLLLLCIFITVAYAAGWIHRLIWFLVETEASKLLNGTTVTMSSLEMDLIRGRYWVSNVVIHAPKRETWKWQAPVLARIGKVYVEANTVQCLLSLWLLGEEIPVELYTVQMSDIQVFIERKHNVYNFLLLDPHVILPAHDLALKESRDGVGSDSVYHHHHPAENNNAHSNSDRSHLEQIDHSSTSIEPKEAEKAQQVIDHIVHAVRRAAQNGDPASLLDHYRHTLTDQLKELTTKKKSVAMQEGVTLLKNVTANITEKTAQAQQVIVPARRALPGERPVYGRVGRVLIQDARIFLLDNRQQQQQQQNLGHEELLKPLASEEDEGATMSSSWNKPIVIKRVAIRASEFCPPLAAKETMTLPHGRDAAAATYDPSLPALYQSLDVYGEVVWKRVLAEVAKSNTGRFFQTAMAEVADLFAESTNDQLQQHD